MRQKITLNVGMTSLNFELAFYRSINCPCESLYQSDFTLWQKFQVLMLGAKAIAIEPFGYFVYFYNYDARDHYLWLNPPVVKENPYPDRHPDRDGYYPDYDEDDYEIEEWDEDDEDDDFDYYVY